MTSEILDERMEESPETMEESAETMFTGQESADIKVSTDGSKVLEGFGSLYLNELFSDVTLVVGGEKFYAHKAILGGRCQYFMTLCNEDLEKKEITILKTSPDAFRLVLEYIYTEIITIPSDQELISQVLVLANRYTLKHLTSSILSNLDTILDVKNVVFYVNVANDHDLEELLKICHLFVDANSLQMLSSDSFNDYSQKSLIQILKRDTFVAPEIEIFQSVATWCEKNNNVDNSVLECVRLSLLTVYEIVEIVRPTNLVNSEKILEAISGTFSKDLRPRGLLSSVDEDTVQCEADLIFALDKTKSANIPKFFRHRIDDNKDIVVRLRKPQVINHIRMTLDLVGRYYSYYIEGSLDQKKWYRLIDYSKYACRSVQNLYFDAKVAEYIKIVGTSANVGNDFHLVFFQAFYESNIPRTVDAIICPVENVATLEKNAIASGGEDPKRLLDGNCEDWAAHDIGDSTGFIVQLAQPYLITTIRLLIPSNYSSRYFIETSVNKTDWEIVIDRRNEDSKSWQDHHFPERVVVFIKIVGTYNAVREYCACRQFQCLYED